MKNTVVFLAVLSLVFLVTNNVFPPVYQPITGENNVEIGRSDRGRDWLFSAKIYQHGDGVWGVPGSGRVSLQMIDTAKRDSLTFVLLGIAAILMILHRERYANRSRANVDRMVPGGGRNVDTVRIDNPPDSPLTQSPRLDR